MDINDTVDLLLLLLASLGMLGIAMSDYLEDALTGWFAGTTFPAVPATGWWIALYTTATDDATGGTEVTGGSYARVNVAATAGQWTRGTGGPGTVSNTNVITFPTATADWGTISHVVIFDAVAGNRVMHGALSAPRVVPNGATFDIPALDLDLTFA